MNTKTFKHIAIALISLTGAAAAFAQEATPDYPQPIHSNVSRAEVRQATLQARAAGQIVDGERSFVALPAGPSLSRAQVVAETLEAIRIGAVERGERSRVITPMQLDSIHMAGLKAVMTMTAGL